MTERQWHDLNSSMIEAAAHDADGLHLRLKGGKTYSYPGLDRSHYDALLAAPSPGRHWHQHLKHLGTAADG